MRFGDLQTGMEMPARARLVTREDVKAYADVGGDQNPLHQDDGFARSVGFQRVIAHGMFTMGHLAQCLVDWLGDRASVDRLKVQFRVPVFMGETIVAGGRVKNLDAEGRTASIELWVTVDRAGVPEYAIRRGEADVSFAE